MFRLVFEAPFRILSASLHVVFINTCFIDRNYTFHEGGVHRSLKDHVFGDLLLMFLLDKIELFQN